jgi:hypothetical protein
MKLSEGDAAWEDLRLHAADWPGFTCVWSIGGGSEEIRGRDCCVGRLGLNPQRRATRTRRDLVLLAASSEGRDGGRCVLRAYARCLGVVEDE